MFLAATFCVSALVAHAGDVASAKAGMRERVSVIDKLKASGAVGEANTGLLAVRDGGADAQPVVTAENADRAVVFEDLAKKNGGTAADAGKAFARQPLRSAQKSV